MNWPSPKDFNDAVRNPAAFTDPDLAAGDAVVGSDGRPVPYTGESSAVYQVCAEDGRGWAVKCFARPDDARPARYAAVRDLLDWAALPFAVPFDFLPEGVRVGEHRWPVLKMDWVEGLPLNKVVRERAESAAVMDALFRRWVQLGRELHTAGIAHGDLQSANVLLVPGNWPGAYTLQLIDYDAMYVPALVNAPASEAGHPNYQHPARTERSYSPDLDRFPLLVVATALKGLAVLGPGLWKRYDTGDNLLFTAADFKNPGASALMRELWRSNDPALRALVAWLGLSCGLPIPETPRIDELAPDGTDPVLSDELARAGEQVFGPVPAAPVPLAAVFTLDEEPAPAPVAPAGFTLDDEPVPVAAPAPVRARPAPLVPVPVMTLDDEDEPEEPRARAKPRPRSKPPARGFPLVPVAIALGLLLLAGGAVAGYLLTRESKPDETAQPRPVEPAPALPAPAPAPAPAPVPPEPEPKPKPPEPPPFAGPPAFHRLWAKQILDDRGGVKVHFGADGAAVYVAVHTRIDSFDAKTGNERPQLRGGSVPAVTLNMWSLDRDRIAAHGFPLKAPGLWDAKTGAPLAALLPRDPLPLPPAGVNETAIECHVSPDGRYVFAGYQGPYRAPGYVPAPYRLVEAGTGKVIAQGDWTFGTVRFTADGSRMLMAETNGRLRWVKTATGEVDVEWVFQANGFPRMIAGMSADGSLFVYFGKPPGLQFDHYLVDGKTGQILRRLGTTFTGDRSVLSADGRWMASLTNEPPTFRQFSALISDTRTGEVLVRTPIEGTLNDLQRAAFTPDGKAFVYHHRGNREVGVYELRGTVAAGQALPIPAPLGPVPERAQPGAAIVVAPPPPPIVPPGNVLPNAPALKARWTVTPEVTPTANQLPQAPLYSKDGGTMILTGGMSGTVLTFDAKTGAAGTTFAGHKGPGGVHWVLPFGADRVASVGFDARRTTWDTKTGKPVDDVKFPHLPPMPDGVRGHAGITYGVSPGGRFTVAARRESVRPVVAGPLRILDTTTGKEVVSAGWNGGRVLFTADESRVFVLDGLGKAKWYKLPSGEADGEWQAGEGIQAEMARVLGMSADGRTILYHGPLAGQPVGVHLLDGKTGQVSRRLNGAPYQASISALSPDGRYVAIGIIDFAGGFVWHVDVFEVATWRLVGRASSPEKNAKEPPHFAFSPDGKDLAVYFRAAKEMSVFPIPGNAP